MQFVGLFSTNAKGVGSLSIRAEVVNAYTVVGLEKGDPQPYALNNIGIFVADPDGTGGEQGTVFGRSEDDPGGGLAITAVNRIGDPPF